MLAISKLATTPAAVLAVIRDKVPAKHRGIKAVRAIQTARGKAARGALALPETSLTNPIIRRCKNHPKNWANLGPGLVGQTPMHHALAQLVTRRWMLSR